MDIERSKYLGGDVAHTHLVKGLDWALYDRTRQSLTQGGGQEVSQRSYPDRVPSIASIVCFVLIVLWM